jgi:hypothetical protein
MPYDKDHVYPHVVSRLGNPKPIEQIRQPIVPWGDGNVLEIGVGPGVNFAHLRSGKGTQGLRTRTQPRGGSAGRRATAPNPAGYRVSPAAWRIHSLGGRERRYRGEHIYSLHDSRHARSHSGNMPGAQSRRQSLSSSSTACRLILRCDAGSCDRNRFLVGRSKAAT